MKKKNKKGKRNMDSVISTIKIAEEEIIDLASSKSELVYIYEITPDSSDERDVIWSKIKSAHQAGELNYMLELLKTYNKKLNDITNSKWMIRIEGEFEPLQRKFNSISTAKDYASKLLKQGKGKAIKILK